MVVEQRRTPGIRSSRKQDPINAELLELAEKSGSFIPSKHFISSVDIDQLNNDFEKFNTYRPWYPNEKQLHLAEVVFRKLFDDAIRGSRVKEPEEAIDDAKKSSSCGYLYKQMGCKNRREVFEKFTPLLLSYVERIRDGENVETIWETAPKIEIRALLKLLNPDLAKRKVRTFLCSDTLCYLVGMMLYSDQNDKLTAMSSKRGWSAVGSTIFHGGWDIFVNYLLEDEETIRKIRAYDIAAMEASISAKLFEIIYSWRHDAIRGEENLKSWFLANKIFSKMLDPNGNVGFKAGSNPSGCINTLTDNTFVVIFCLIYHLVGKLLKLETYTDDEVIDNVINLYEELPVKAMGDDTIMADHEIWEGIEDSTLEIGFSFEKELPPSGDFPMLISEAKFLNFGFEYDVRRNMWMFVPNYDKLFAGLFYWRKSDSWRLTLAKLYAMRVLCYTNTARYLEVESYIQAIWEKHDVELRAERVLKDSNGDELLPYQNLKSMGLTCKQIEFLLYGLECGSEVVPQDQACSAEKFQQFLEVTVSKFYQK